MSTIQVFFFLFIISYVVSASSELRYEERRKMNWDNHGGDIFNRRYASGETKISPQTASRLALKWKFKAGKDVTATPAIHDGILYFPSWNGNVYAVEAASGSLVWKFNLSDVTNFSPLGKLGLNYTVARATPTVAGHILIIGIYAPAVVIGVNRQTGKLIWTTRLDSHAASLITMSGSFYRGNYYVGTSSLEETLSIGECCTFRGSFAKLDARTGAVRWQTFMLPDNNGSTKLYSGAAVWGSSPSIDAARNLVYIATGNLYTVPQTVQNCQLAENNQTHPAHPDACLGSAIHSDSILALDMTSGNIKWSRQIGGYDVWFLSCADPSTPGCPPGPNPDADFGEAPMMLTVNANGKEIDIVVAGQKSGYVWALNRDDGSLLWSTEAGPGSIAGGATWGSATDGERVYTNIANFNAKNFTLKPSAQVTNAGGWVAMDGSSGKVVWSTANPSNSTSPGPVTVANGVLFAGSAEGTGPVYAFDTKTGSVLWSYTTGATVHGGMSVSDGCVYVGHGYTFGIGSLNSKYTAGSYVFAFCVA